MIFKDYSLDLGLQGSFAQNLRYFGTNKNDLNQSIAQYEPPVMCRGNFGVYYGYQATSPKKGQRRVMKTLSYNIIESKIYYDTPEAEAWRKDVDGLKNLQSSIRSSGITLAIEVPILLLIGRFVAAGVAGATIIKKAASYLGLFLGGIKVMGDDNPFAIAKNLFDYVLLENETIRVGNACCFADGPLQ